MSRHNDQAGQTSQASTTHSYYYYAPHPPPLGAFGNGHGPFPGPPTQNERHLSHLANGPERPESPANFLKSPRVHAIEDSYSTKSNRDSTRELMAAYAGLFEGAVLVLQYKDQKTIIKRPHKLDGVIDEAIRAFDLNGPDARILPGIITPAGWIPIAPSAYDLLKDATLIILRPVKNDPIGLPPYTASAAGTPRPGGAPIPGPIAAPVPTPGIINAGSNPGSGSADGQGKGEGKAAAPKQHLG